MDTWIKIEGEYDIPFVKVDEAEMLRIKKDRIKRYIHGKIIGKPCNGCGEKLYLGNIIKGLCRKCYKRKLRRKLTNL